MNRRTDAVCWLCVTWAVVFSVAGWAWADESDAQSQSNQKSSVGGRMSLLNPKAVLDSAISWSDVWFFQQWKIQQHVDTRACRLLDEDGKSHAAGTYEECRAQLESIKRDQNLAPMQGKAVVLMHGLAAPAWSMQLLARHLRKNGGYETFVVEYSSLRSTIDDQARSLARVIQSLEGIEEINMVGHSMGNIVIRRYLAGDTTPGDGWRPDPRVARVVMIAPPNHGSTAATRLSDNSVFKTVFGQSGQQLGVNWDDLESRLATPSTEFGIIAGGWGNKLGLNPFEAGDDDGRISVETTRLAGAADFLVVPAVHEFIAHDPRVLNYTLTFLTSGYFVSLAEKRGIPHGPLAEQTSPRRR